MQPPRPPQPPDPVVRLPVMPLLLIAGLAVASLAVVYASRRQARQAAAARSDDPRLAYAGPYRNVRPEVNYVGDAACADCHAEQTVPYRHHPMGRSFGPVAAMEPIERYDAAAGNPFETLGYRFLVRHSAERTTHAEQRPDARGQVVAEWRADVAYTMGSGTRGRSYVIDHAGYLFQSPVSWFSQKHAWDLSPGFEVQVRPERPLTAACLFCHCNDARPVEHTVNRYHEPLFRQFAIGCERCHGPGELHVQARERGEPVGEPDVTIVNPKRLEPALREAVCEQCHLQAESRVVRRGLDTFAFRPGLPLHQFLSVFVRRPELTDRHRAVGHVEQMHVSRCYRASGGKLGCISCHDPHALPAPERRVAFYRDRCLACHAQKGCGLPAEARRQQQPDDSCVACHMQRFASSDIAHTAVTDHRVLRRPEPRADAPEKPTPLRPGEVPLVHFHHDLVGPGDAGVGRDLGIALVDTARENPAAARNLSPLALPLLEAALRERPDDVPAWEAKGYAQWGVQQTEEARRSYAAALEQAPERETCLLDAAMLADAVGDREAAVGYWRRAVAVDPWVPHYHYQLARLLADGGQWQAALAECEAAVRLNPCETDPRVLAVTCLLRTGDKERARREFEALMAQRPPDEEVLRRWFAEQER